MEDTIKDDTQLTGFRALMQFILTNKRKYLDFANGTLETEFRYEDLPFLFSRGLDLLKDHPEKEIIQKIAFEVLEVPFHPLSQVIIVDIRNAD